MLEARAICRNSREGRPLLRDVALKVDSGDRVAISGSTGAGKSLLLRALALLDPIDSGDVCWQGTSVADRSVPEFRSRVMYVQQRPTLIEGTVEQNLRMPFELRIHRRRSFERDWFRKRLADLQRVESFLEQDVTHLSGGERQIVAVLRALALAPSILLLDEPTASLDADSVEQIELMIRNWHQKSPERACVWVTHDVRQAARMGSRRLRMEAGRLIETGTQ